MTSQQSARAMYDESTNRSQNQRSCMIDSSITNFLSNFSHIEKFVKGLHKLHGKANKMAHVFHQRTRFKG